MSIQRKLLVFLVGAAMWFGLLFYLFITICHAADVTLALNPNSTTDPAGYKLHWGQESREYTDSLDLGPRARDVQFTVTIGEIIPGKTYYFTATAYDGAGNKSAYSNEVFKLVPLVAPTLGEIEITIRVIVK